jgi:hypothetical protein
MHKGRRSGPKLFPASPPGPIPRGILKLEETWGITSQSSEGLGADAEAHGSSALER